MIRKSITTDFTIGSIPQQLIRFAFPFMLSNALQLVYSLVDMVVVGKFVGSAGLSAVSNSSTIIHFCTMLSLGFCTGGQVLISQYIGAGKREKIGQIIGTLFSVILALSLLFTCILCFFKESILNLIDIPDGAYRMAVDYLLICGIGTVFTFGYNMVSAVLRGMGDSTHPFLFILIASAVNLVLDVVFTGMLKMGVAGAAAATVIGQASSLTFSVIFLFKRREELSFDFTLQSVRPEKNILRNLFKLGIPYAIQSSAINLSMLYLNSMVNGLGVYASAAFSVGAKLDDIASKLSQGIMYAVSPMVGQNYAAGNRARVKTTVNYGVIYSGFIYIIYAILFLCFSKQLFSLFSSEEEVLILAPVFACAAVWGFPAMAVMRATGGFIQGIGNAKLSMVLGILDGVVARIVMSYVLGIVLDLGFFGFVFGFSFASWAYCIPSVVYYLFGKWGKVSQK